MLPVHQIGATPLLLYLLVLKVQSVLSHDGRIVESEAEILGCSVAEPAVKAEPLLVVVRTELGVVQRGLIS